MSHFNPGLISAYNSLTDKHLAGYFSNTRIRRHLHRAGLITRSGRIVPDKEYRHKLIQRAHQRHIRECLAQAIFHKVLEMERLHQIEIKRKLEEFARRERVHKIKVGRSKRYEEEIIRILSPRPPTGARGVRKQHSGPEGEHSESSESPTSSRPNTAPGKMQRPVRLKPIHSNSTTAALRRSSPYRLHESSNENGQSLNCTMDKESRRRLTTTDASPGISPYCLPVINNFITPVPPPTKRKERGVKVTPSGTLRGRRLRPTTASSGADVNEEPPMLRSSVHQSRVCVNMVYFGKTVHLSHDLSDMRDEVKVFQQHCGGENLCVYKGKLREGEMFQFISRRHRGFPFSLTFFLNGLQVERLSSCCEFKHRKGPRLGGRHGHFGFSGIEGASPCYKCIIAMGLDKKPTPPPKRVKDDGEREETTYSPKDTAEMETERIVEDAVSPSECETSQPQDMETQVKEETAPKEDKLRDGIMTEINKDYEEDFEADDEGATEDAEAKENKSPSPSRETEKQVQERVASDSEDDEKDEDAKSHSGSSSSSSDREESDTEAPKDSRENEKAEQPTEVDHEETVAPSDENNEPNLEEATAVESAAAAKDSDIQDSAGDSTEIEISDASAPSGNENKQSDDTSGDKEDEKMVDESKQEEEQERAKSVQEKLAEAILKESQCSSEPELSDTSTEEEEEAVDKGHKQDEEKNVVVVEAEVVQEETPEPKEQKDENEQGPHECSESSRDEMVRKDEGTENTASEDKDKATVEKDESEVTEDADAAPHPVSEEKMSEDDKTSESQDNAQAKSTEAEAAEKDEENKQKTAVDAETRPDETWQGAKSSGEDESSVSELNKKTDETAVPDNAEAEAKTASETMKMKAEPSEEQEALNCEEPSVTDAERQQEDGKDRNTGSETQVTADHSSSSSEESRDTTVHTEKTGDTSENNAKDESSKDNVKEEVEEADDCKYDSENQVCEAGKEIEKSVEINDKVEEEKSEEGRTNRDEIAEGESTEDREKGETDKTEEESVEIKAEEKVENEENITEGSKTDSNTEGRSEEDKVVNEEKADESEKTENGEDDGNHVDSECVEDKDGEEGSEGKGAAADKTSEGEEIKLTDGDEEKGDGAEETENNEDDNEAEESEAINKDEEESEEKKIITDEIVKGEEISDITEKPEEGLDEDLDKDDMKVSDKNIVDLEDVGDSEAGEANGTKMTEEMLNNVTDAENVEKEVEESENGERGEIDAENGEMSTGAESKTNEDEAEAPTEDKNNFKSVHQVEEEERKTDDLKEKDEIEDEKVTVESGDGAEKHEDNMVDQVSVADKVGSEAEEGEVSVENQEESNKNDFEPVIYGAAIKEETKCDNLNTERKDSETEEMKEDPGDNDSDSKDSNTQNQVSEVIAASSGDRAQSSTPVAVDLDNTDHKEKEESDSKSEKDPCPDEKTAAVDLSAAADLSAVDGENGVDTEEASKASEEGASVLLKPQAQSTELTHNDADNTQESTATGEETPEALAKEDNRDMVTNWVTMHQTSNYFEKFVEPLEDLRDSDAQTSNSNIEATQSTELLRSVSPLQTVKMSDGEAADAVENAEEDTQKYGNDAGGKTEVEAVQSDLESNESEDDEPHEKDPGKDTLQVEEEKNLSPNTETEQNVQDSGTKPTREDMRLEEHRGSRVSLKEDKIQDGPAQRNTEETDISKTEVESIAGASGKPDSVTENQNEEKMTEKESDLHEKQTAAEERKDPLSSPKTEEHQQCSESPQLISPDKKADEQKSAEETQEETVEESQEVTEITDITTAKLDDGSQEETEPKPSDSSINRDKRDTQLIQDINRTLSKDRLSTFSVDETLFGRSSHPLLTAARTESGH